MTNKKSSKFSNYSLSCQSTISDKSMSDYSKSDSENDSDSYVHDCTSDSDSCSSITSFSNMSTSSTKSNKQRIIRHKTKSKSKSKSNKSIKSSESGNKSIITIESNDNDSNGNDNNENDNKNEIKKNNLDCKDNCKTCQNGCTQKNMRKDLLYVYDIQKFYRIALSNLTSLIIQLTNYSTQLQSSANNLNPINPNFDNLIFLIYTMSDKLNELYQYDQETNTYIYNLLDAFNILNTDILSTCKQNIPLVTAINNSINALKIIQQTLLRLEQFYLDSKNILTQLIIQITDINPPNIELIQQLVNDLTNQLNSLFTEISPILRDQNNIELTNLTQISNLLMSNGYLNNCNK